MNKNLLWLILGLLVFPLVCRANVAMGFLINYLPVFFLSALLGICVIEAWNIEKYLHLTKTTAFLVALVLNLITSAIGIGATKIINIDPLGTAYLGVFVLSFLIESLLLKIFSKNYSWKSLFKTGLIMNFESYIFLFAFFMSDMFALTPIIAVFIFYHMFKLLIPQNKFKKNIFILLSIILAANLYFFIIYQMPKPGNKPKDFRIISVIAQSRTIMSYISANNEDYSQFSCFYLDMEPLCSEIKKNYKDGNDNVPIIARSADFKEACIYSPLNGAKKSNPPDKWYCADSIGHSGYTSTSPDSVKYCIEGKSAVCPPLEM